MAYTPQTWTDSPATTSPLSATRLNYMETGIAGALTRAVSTVTTTTTLSAASSTDYVVFLGASAAVTLPTAVANVNRYTLKNIDTANKSIATTSSQTIDGSTTLTITPGASAELVSDGTNWRVL